MVNYNFDVAFAALADGTRRAILARLAESDASVGELAAPFAMSLPAVSKHLKLLERAGLIHRERDGRVHRCRLDPDRLRAITAWLEHQRRCWEDRFYALDGD